MDLEIKAILDELNPVSTFVLLKDMLDEAIGYYENGKMAHSAAVILDMKLGIESLGLILQMVAKVADPQEYDDTLNQPWQIQAKLRDKERRNAPTD